MSTTGTNSIPHIVRVGDEYYGRFLEQTQAGSIRKFTAFTYEWISVFDNDSYLFVRTDKPSDFEKLNIRDSVASEPRGVWPMGETVKDEDGDTDSTSTPAVEELADAYRSKRPRRSEGLG